MKAFAELYAALDQTTKTNGKIAALTRYLSQAPPEDAAWAVSFLIGRRPKRLLESRKLAEWAIAEAGVPDWLFGECYHAVGDFAETIALLLPPARIVQPAAAARSGWRSACCRCAKRTTMRAARNWSRHGARWMKASASPGTS